MYNVVTSIVDERSETEKALEKAILKDILDGRLEDRNKEFFTIQLEKEGAVEKFNDHEK